MRPVQSLNAFVVQAPAKVNLFLEVLKRRADGFHDVNTCMAAVDLFDTLEFQDTAKRRAGSDDIVLSSSEPTLPTGPDNLVCRAAELLRQHAGVRMGARIRLTKRIPLAAGLAGGSSDAAGTLIGLNRLWKLGLRRAELARLAEQLGSDVPFFLAGNAAWCTGRGERVRPFKLRKPLHLVLVNPGVPCSTAEVYRGVKVPRVPRSPDEVLAALRKGEVEQLGRALFNRLQESAERVCPAVARLRKLCAKLDAPGQMMSGSGSTYFLLARTAAHARQLATTLRIALVADGTEARVFVVKTIWRSRGPFREV
jgi:4-diphosphocytidyl-2-C-methyl-D-erythritol kinase